MNSKRIEKYLYLLTIKKQLKKMIILYKSNKYKSFIIMVNGLKNQILNNFKK